MRAALAAGEAVVLFPGDDAATPSDLRRRDGPLDVVAIDGTWEQASRLDKRLPGQRVRLDDDVVAALGEGEGRQLRSHPTPWREVSTLTAIRHCLGALGADASRLADYQAVADAGARAQLGPPRVSERRAAAAARTRAAAARAAAAG